MVSQDTQLLLDNGANGLAAHELKQDVDPQLLADAVTEFIRVDRALSAGRFIVVDDEALQ